MYSVCFCIWHCACSCFSIFDTYCSIICSSLSEVDDACHTNKMVVYHKASRSLCRFEHTPQSWSDLMFESWFREWLCNTVLSKINLPLLSLSSILCTSMVAVPTGTCEQSHIRINFNFHGWLHPRKLSKANLCISMKYLWCTVLHVYSKCNVGK